MPECSQCQDRTPQCPTRGGGYFIRGSCILMKFNFSSSTVEDFKVDQLTYILPKLENVTCYYGESLPQTIVLGRDPISYNYRLHCIPFIRACRKEPQSVDEML